jgi:flavorubredoxin
MEVVGNLQVRGRASDEDLKNVEKIGRELAQKMKT